LTYVTALAALGIQHALHVVAGAGANGIMDVDAGSVVEALIEALPLQQRLSYSIGPGGQ
jgi:hypothetical protein